MVLGYETWMWFTKRAMTNIICLKNISRLYWVTYNSKRRTALIVHCEKFGLTNMVFDMHSCGLHIYYPEKADGMYSFVQAIADNMKLSTKQQIECALKVHHLYRTLAYPSNADFEAVLRVSSIWRLHRHS